MNPATLVMLIQPLATPAITALLSDPRPGRVWIKVSAVFTLTLLATYLQLQNLTITPEIAVETFLKTLLYNQGIHRLFKHSFDNLEGSTGNGVGIVADALAQTFRKPTADPWAAPATQTFPEN